MSLFTRLLSLCWCCAFNLTFPREPVDSMNERGHAVPLRMTRSKGIAPAGEEYAWGATLPDASTSQSLAAVHTIQWLVLLPPPLHCCILCRASGDESRVVQHARVASLGRVGPNPIQFSSQSTTVECGRVSRSARFSSRFRVS